MYQNFPGNFISAVTGHDCCDFCASSCICDDSDCVIKTKLTVRANSESNTTVCQSVRNVNREQRESLSVKMETDRKKLVSEKYLWTYCTTILQELTHFHIDQVLDKRDKLKTLNYVHTAIEMWRKEHSRAIINAVNEGFANVAIGELNFFYGYSLLSKLIETCSVLPLISCSSNIKPALTLTHHRANPSEVKDLT